MIYPFKVSIQECDGHTYWVAKSSLLKGCVGQGDNPEEAITELADNEKEWLESAKEFGIPIPEVPVLRADGYSGKLTIRIAPIEHSKAAYYAKEEGVSLNKYISDAIVSRNSELSLAQ